MKNLSVKTKIFLTFIGISLLGLSAFSFMTFSTYKKDKLAYVYDQILGQTKSLSSLMRTVSEKYDVLLGATVTQLKHSGSKLSKATERYLDESKSAQFVGVQIGSGESKKTNTLLDNGAVEVKWNEVASFGEGIHPLDIENGRFVYKRKLEEGKGFSFVVFQNGELSRALSAGGSQALALLKGNEVFTKTDWEGGKNLFSSARQQLEAAEFSPYGLREIEVNGVDYLAAFSKNKDGSFLFSLTKLEDLLLVQKVFTLQLIGFLSLMAFVSLLVGVIASDRLTKYLGKLTQAAKDVEREKFDLDLNIKSGDEFEVLGSAFTSMSSRIQKLLSELRRYNTQLEEMVAERTAQLQRVTNIQKAMLNALGQAFVIVDENKKVLPVYSKVAEEMFEAKPDESDFLDLLKVDDDNRPVMSEFFDHVFQGALDFDTMAKLAPAERTNSKNRRIFFEYAPISDEESGEMSHMMLVGTDRTDEIEAREKFERQWKFSQMIMNIVGDRQGFIRVVEDSRKMLDEAEEIHARGGKDSLLEIQRRLHTIKGNFGFFYIDEITVPAGNAESEMDKLMKGEETGLDVLAEVRSLKNTINDFVKRNEEVIGVKEAQEGRVVSLRSIEEFESELRDRELKRKFQELFYQVNIGSFFGSYEKYTSKIADKLGKKIRFELQGADLNLPEGEWADILPEFIHIARNSLDHGIESPAKRKEAGKPEEGLLRFAFDVKQNEQGRLLHVKLVDDGKGIDVEALSKKNPEITDMQSAIKFLALGGLSSRDSATELSGRGVGLSAVVQKTVQLGGEWKVDSRPGEGTEIELLIPVDVEAGEKKSAA